MRLISAATSGTFEWRSTHIRSPVLRELIEEDTQECQISGATTTQLPWLLYHIKFHFLEDQVPIASEYMGNSTILYIA